MKELLDAQELANLILNKVVLEMMSADVTLSTEEMRYIEMGISATLVFFNEFNVQTTEQTKDQEH